MNSLYATTAISAIQESIFAIKENIKDEEFKKIMDNLKNLYDLSKPSDDMPIDMTFVQELYCHPFVKEMKFEYVEPSEGVVNNTCISSYTTMRGIYIYSPHFNYTIHGIRPYSKKIFPMIMCRMFCACFRLYEIGIFSEFIRHLKLTLRIAYENKSIIIPVMRVHMQKLNRMVMRSWHNDAATINMFKYYFDRVL